MALPFAEFVHPFAKRKRVQDDDAMLTMVMVTMMISAIFTMDTTMTLTKCREADDDKEDGDENGGACDDDYTMVVMVKMVTAMMMTMGDEDDDDDDNDDAWVMGKKTMVTMTMVTMMMSMTMMLNT